uniref:At1g61320/AtMIF1 LRR domain-containing protein n=1 Tax=Arundo donax TaxID=35708 RepID=A0A0A9BZ02_ARUDO
MYYKGAQTFHALEVIRLHYVFFTEAVFRKMMALCPSLRTLDLRGCDYDCIFYWGSCMVLPANLRRITIAECDGTTTLDLVPAPSLRSFLYSGSFFDAPFSLPGDAMLADLYICLSYSMSGSYSTKKFNKALPNDLSGLNVLTICSNALPAASSLSDDGLTAQLPKLSNLHSLRELQLLMLKMEATNLADIYVFLKTCQCPNLERLFVQLPIFNCESMEGSLDAVGEEPPEGGLDNLKIVKVMNFNWRCTELQLVSFLLRKATSLQKLLLVSPNIAPLDMPGLQEADLLLVKEALANAKIMLTESDDAATQPYHSEVFIEV